MNPKIDWYELFFSSSGRTRQTPFIIALVILLLAVWLYEAVAVDALRLLTFWIVYPFLFFVAANVLSKRLHDRGRSGWWALVILVAFVMVWPVPREFSDAVGALVLLWAFVDLVLMPGERGFNRHGPPAGRVMQAGEGI